MKHEDSILIGDKWAVLGDIYEVVDICGESRKRKAIFDRNAWRYKDYVIQNYTLIERNGKTADDEPAEVSLKIKAHGNYFRAWNDNCNMVCVNNMSDHIDFIRFDWSNHPNVAEDFHATASVLYQYKREDMAMHGTHYRTGATVIRPKAVIMKGAE